MTDIIERLRSISPYLDVSSTERTMKEAADEIERLRTALQQIIAEAESDDGLTAWDGADIARRALENKP